MQIKINTNQTSNLLTWGQIKNQEGIYKIDDSLNERIIVTKHKSENNLFCFLFINVDDKFIEPLLPDYGKYKKFIKTNETLSFNSN